MKNGLRGQVRLQVDGQLKSGRDIILMALLGAEEFSFGTAALIVLGCVMMRKCNLNTCPMGVATQDPKLRAHFRGSYKYLINYFRFLAEEVREYLAEMGYTSLNDIIGHTELIVRKSDEEVVPAEGSEAVDSATAKFIEQKADLLDFSRLLHREAGHGSLYHTTEQIHDLANVLDQQLVRGAQNAIEKQEEVNLDFAIKNTDRAAGAMLSGAIAAKYGEAGLPDKTVNVKFKGSAGQSFGAFLVKGVDFKLEGETNDYFAKGLSGGRISILPPIRSNFSAEDNIIAGNTGLYGATSGELYINGKVGERFRSAQLWCHRCHRGCWRPLLRVHDRRTRGSARRDGPQLCRRYEWRCGLRMGQEPQLRLLLQHGYGGNQPRRGQYLPQGTARAHPPALSLYRQ